MKELRFRITGVVPLVVHSIRLADPLDQLTKKLKEVSSKRNKTEEDYEAMARLEWYGGLYVKDGRPVIPGTNIESMMLESARKRRKGKQVQVGIICPDDPPIIYDGPTDIDELWASDEFRLTAAARIRGSRVMRTRPIFREWALEFSMLYDPQLLNEDEVVSMLEEAGKRIGLCDWRPKFGRFAVEKL